MRALVFRGPWEIGVEERPEAGPGPGEVLVRVIATGICGSDVHGFTGENGRRHPGQVMGHETVGRVAALGAGVTGPEPGAVVTVNPVIACGQCPACRADAQQSCPDRRVIGVDPRISSAFAQAMVVPAANVVPLPAGMPIEYGALVEPLAVGYHAARRGGVSGADRVLVIGGGPIGQACVLAARRLGAAAIAASEPDGRRRALVARLGAATVDPSAADLAAACVRDLGAAPTVVIDAVGGSRTLGDALAASGPGARVVLVGMNEPRVELPAYAISTEERTLVGSFCYSASDFWDTAAWAGGAPPELAGLVDGRIGLDDAAAAFAGQGRGALGAGKTLVFPDGVPERR